MVRHSSACGLTSSQRPCTSSSDRSGGHADHPGDVVGPQGPELVDLPEVLPHRVVAEGQVCHGVEVRHAGRRRAGPFHDRLEAGHGIVPQEVPVEFVRARLVHGAARPACRAPRRRRRRGSSPGCAATAVPAGSSWRSWPGSVMSHCSGAIWATTRASARSASWKTSGSAIDVHSSLCGATATPAGHPLSRL